MHGDHFPDSTNSKLTVTSRNDRCEQVTPKTTLQFFLNIIRIHFFCLKSKAVAYVTLNQVPTMTS